ncbi:hypothetical protein [Sphingomonas panni]|uniref:hypothetical protein n=1 Tax=Sphingomonas panni TaxID=237612 RepID=UPI001F5B3590|nr:hypothetical protein [Sphingomonas panni]
MNEQVLKVDEVDNSHTAGNAKNGLLSRLDTVSRAALAPHLELVPFRNADMIARAGDKADSICFH